MNVSATIVAAAKLTGAQWLRQGRTRRKSAGR